MQATKRFFTVFALVGAIGLLQTDHARAQEPTSEAMIETLNKLYPLLESKEFDKALEHFQLPERFLANRDAVKREFGKMIEIQEISLPGIERLKRDGKFGTAIEVFGEERAKMFAERMEADVEKSYGYQLESAEVMAVWNGAEFKFVRLDDVGKLAPVSGNAKSENADAVLKESLEFESKNKIPQAWEGLKKARKLGNKSKELVDAVNRCMRRFANVGIFEVGITDDSLVNRLGEPHEKIDLGKDRQRLIYGSWGVDFRSNKLHEVIDLRGATESLFHPTETLNAELDGRDWTTKFRKKQKGHVIAYLYAEKYSKNWREQIVVERFLNKDSISAEDFAKHEIEFGQKHSSDAKQKILVKDDSSVIFAAEIPMPNGKPSLHRLTRIMKGPKDIHKITYTIRSSEAPTMETQKKWLGIFQNAKLNPVVGK